MAGLRVIRSGDWKWGDVLPGGEGHCGTTTGIKTKPGWVEVLWDNGSKGDYRTGAYDQCDLLVLDNGPAGVSHPCVVCDVCQEVNIRGLRWKCVDCPDFDLCTECYGNDRHDISHNFKRIDTPADEGYYVGRRRNATKVQSKGLYESAKVVRGDNWDKSNEDGGAGCEGTVTKLLYVRDDGRDKAALVVKWPHDTTNGYIYRRGLGGNVDVKYKVPASGWFYYRDHLPHLGDVTELAQTNEVNANASAALQATDLFQITLSPLTCSSIDSAGKILEPKKVDSDQRKETLANFAVGDLVRLENNIDKVIELQKDHGGYSKDMVEALGKTGRITDIDNDGCLFVVVGAQKWFINPKLVKKQTQGESVRPSTSARPRSAFRPGDSIVLSKGVREARSLQEGHGGWQAGMEQLAGGIVAGVMRDSTTANDLLVSFGDKCFILNQDVCAKASKQKLRTEDSEVTQSMLIRIAGTVAIKEWKLLARMLGLVETDVIQIEHAHRNDLKECAYQMLYKWQQQTGHKNATVGALTDALEKVGLKSTAEDIVKMVGIS